MFIVIMVSFIVCDEKWINFELKNGKIIIHKQENNPSNTGKVELKPVAIYKNTDFIRINPEFENPKTLSKSLDIDKDFTAKKKEERENRIKSISLEWDSLTSILTEYSETNTWKTETMNREKRVRTWTRVIKTWSNEITTWNSVSKTWNSMNAWIRTTRTWNATTKIAEISSWNTEIKTWNNNIKSRTTTSNIKTWSRTTLTWNTETKSKTKTWTTSVNTWTTMIKTWNTTKTWKISADTWTKLAQKEKKQVNVYKWRWCRLSLKKWKEPIEIKETVESYKWTSDEINLKWLVKIEPTEEEKIKVEKYEWKTTTLNLWQLKKVEEEIQDTDIETDRGNLNEENLDVIKEDIENEKIDTEENISDIMEENFTDNSEEITTNSEEDLEEKYEKIDENIINEKDYDAEDIMEEDNKHQEETEIIVYYVDKYRWRSEKLELKKWIRPINDKRIAEKYKWEWLTINLKKAKKISQEENIVANQPKEEFWFSEEILSSLLENEEIDINAIESENDEFLQKIFQETWDPKIMNLILETYISEYQFAKAKKFIENLNETFSNQIDPLLYLQISFNSFSLSSNTTNETLKSIIQKYQSDWKISEDDGKWYEWVIYLMNKDYNKFFEIASWFTTENHVKFVSRLNEYKNQIKTQMWMPDYYFDTLVALELFNQWLFQPAKVLALSSLTQNPSYILPYQVLAYANFLTNSRDTSIEYLNKLTELDPENVEKYRFLMWIAYYWNEQYEQSVLMLSQIRNENLRLDAERYLIRDYIILDQKTKLISSRWKLLWYENLSSSDFYTYFYETFYHPYAEWKWFDLYLSDRDLADKMIRVCSMKLWNDERVVCNYWEIWKDIALSKFDNLEKSLLDLVSQYPQWYLYQALWDYYIQQWDLEKAKVYLLKAISLTQEKSERSQIKKLLQDTM